MIEKDLPSETELQLRTNLRDEVSCLFEAHRGGLLRYLMSFGLAIQDCEEIGQEVFVALLQHLGRGRGRENLRGWIFRVGHNLALRKRKRAGREIDLGERQFRDRNPGPEDQAALIQRQHRLLAVVRALSHEDQCCLHLRAEGLRYREIAEVLGMSLGGVAASLSRSLGKLSSVEARMR